MLKSKKVYYWPIENNKKVILEPEKPKPKEFKFLIKQEEILA